MLRLDRAACLAPVELGAESTDLLLADLTPEQRAASWHLISPDGDRWSAGAAAPPLLRLLPGGRAPAAVLAAAPRATERAYRWVSDHRSILGKLIPEAAKRRADEVIGSRMGIGRPR